MDVIFQTKSDAQNRFTIGNLEGYGRVFFDKGTLITQDKELIKLLLNSPLKKRGEYKLVSNEKMVADYLDGNEPDVLTQDIMDNLTRQGVIELGELLNSSQTEPTLIKAEVKGSYITNAVQDIINFYSIDKKAEVKEEAEQAKTKRTKSPGRPKKTVKIDD